MVVNEYEMASLCFTSVDFIQYFINKEFQFWMLWQISFIEKTSFWMKSLTRDER